MHFESLYKTVIEKDEHKKSREYKRLSPKMKKLWMESLKLWMINPQIS